MEQTTKENLNINVEPSKDGVFTILHGSAPAPVNFSRVQINGHIDSAGNYLEKRSPNLQNTHIEIDRDNMIIQLIESPQFRDSSIVVIGSLTLSEDFKKWSINSGEGCTAKQLSEFIKMNRASFVDKSIAMKLSKELQEIKIKTEKELEKTDNNRGDYKVVIAQKIISNNIPESFKLSVPIFKGTPAVDFEVEIYISPDSFNCSLISPEANDIVAQVRNQIIDDEKNRIETMSDILIIEK